MVTTSTNEFVTYTIRPKAILKCWKCFIIWTIYIITDHLSLIEFLSHLSSFHTNYRQHLMLEMDDNKAVCHVRIVFKAHMRHYTNLLSNSLGWFFPSTDFSISSANNVFKILK